MFETSFIVLLLLKLFVITWMPWWVVFSPLLLWVAIMMLCGFIAWMES